MCVELQRALERTRRWARRRPEIYRRKAGRMRDREGVTLVWSLKGLYWYLTEEKVEMERLCRIGAEISRV